ncbi:hypothetical protein [Marimonas lutisalis]|uniref:hypothetical protein n=1 Tax=Marimonas lutisalis TaxID=2545756 RepID=UPI0010F8D0C8|nr:hypothetical protein [Marimonas lutisalis]
MEQMSFEDRLAKIEDRSRQDLTERRFDSELQGMRGKARRQAGHVPEDEDEDSDVVFWVIYAALAILMAAAYVQVPQFAYDIKWHVFPVFALVGIVKVFLTMRRRGLSITRDGDNLLDLADTISGLYRLFK